MKESEEELELDLLLACLPLFDLLSFFFLSCLGLRFDLCGALDLLDLDLDLDLDQFL